MTTLQKTSRASFVRQRRNSKDRSTVKVQRPSTGHQTPAAKPSTQTARQSYRPSTVHLTGIHHKSTSRASHPSTKNSSLRSYDIAFSVGRTAIHAPALSLPRFSTRWVSGALAVMMAFALYTMWTASAFTITTADLHGNQRLSVEDINGTLGVLGQPIFKAVPAQIADNLRNAFIDLSSVQVSVGFPNRIEVNIVERTPVLSWNEDGTIKWIDVNGLAFSPRGDVPELLQVTATSAPEISLDPNLPLYEQKFIAPDMVQALLTLAPDVPAGMALTYDPTYGIGWKDPRGWSVYFGQNTNDIAEKKVIYQAIVDTLTRQGIQPSLISVEYLNAPFYK